MNFLETPIEFLKGVGPQRAEVLKKELGIRNFEDLLNHFPFRYVDKSKFWKVNEVNNTEIHVQLKGKIERLREQGEGRAKRLTAVFIDETGEIELVWFKGLKWIKSAIHYGETYVVYGKLTLFNRRWNMTHPELEKETHEHRKLGAALAPVYSTTEKSTAKGLHSKGIEKLTKNLLLEFKNQVPETLPENLIAHYKFPALSDCYREVHAPTSERALAIARQRLKFDELLILQLILLRGKLENTKKLQGYNFENIGDHFNSFYSKYLKYELTGAQKRVLKEIRADVRTGAHMNRMIQGDVGSGKTLVALISALIAIDNGYQVCIMAPTEILANQHFEGISDDLKSMDIEIGLLTGSTKKSARNVLHEKLQSGELDLLIGTHALIEPTVVFKNLGLAIIDEQHRFGVKQRAKLWAKNVLPPHVLVMTATPIPRTLAMTLYGDLDVSVIDEMPPGRKPITTVHKRDTNRLSVFQFIEDEVTKGRQIYVVYPLIEESEKLDLKDLMDGYESISRRFPMPKYQLSIVHGRMKAADKEYEMQRFVKHETQIMVATTVIEVGVNVPNASVMIIENAERFGLAQLHQLRGRVGRGAEKSFCILMTKDKLSQDSKTRIQTMVETNNGFKISEVDLQLRGPGDIMGTMQSGNFEMKIADLAEDHKILAAARDLANMLLADDPDLVMEKNRRIKNHLNKTQRRKPNWGRVS